MMVGNPVAPDPDDCGSSALGRAVGAVLRVEMWGISKALSFEAPMDYWIDSAPSLESSKTLRAQRTAERTDARWQVEGKLGAVQDGWSIEWSVLDRVRGGTLRLSLPIRNAQANADLVSTAQALLDLVGAQADPAEAVRLEQLRGQPVAAFSSLVRAFEGSCEAGGDYADQIAHAWQTHPSYATLAVLYQESFERPDRASRRIELNKIGSAAGSSPISGIYVARALALNSPRSEGVEDLPALRALAARYPHEPGALFALSNALSSYSLLYADSEQPGARVSVVGGPEDHPARYAEAMALAARTAELLPRHYRSWSNLAEALTMYQQAIRGTCGWSCVPASAKARLPALNALFDQIVQRGLSIYPESAPLLAALVMADVDMGREWWPSFLFGVRAQPEAFYLYQKAMIFAGDSWGGNAGQRRQVYELAKENNPDADWPLQLYVDYAPGSETILTRFGYLAWILLAAIAGVALFRWTRSRMP
jgi:hypothetical protein